MNEKRSIISFSFDKSTFLKVIFPSPLSTLSINLVRMLEEEAMKTNKPLTVYLPVRLATYLLNDKRELIQGIEERQKISIKVVPDNTIEGANYHIDKDNLTTEAFKASLNNKSIQKNNKTLNETSAHYEEALVSSVTPNTQPPKPATRKNKTFKKNIGIFESLINKIKRLFGLKPKKSYKNKSYNGRKRFNSRNHYSKYNKYKSYNKRKNYSKKNNNLSSKSKISD